MRSFAEDLILTEDHRGNKDPDESGKVFVFIAIFGSTLLAAGCRLSVDAAIRNLTADFADFTDSL